MKLVESFSVYNAQTPGVSGRQHPLADLVPEDREHGWHVARNLLKPLNHLDFLRHKERLATELNLHNLHTPETQFDINYGILSRHQAKELTTAEVIRHLATQTGLTDGEVTERLRAYAGIHHMEFHPSDVCNLTCRGCTYGHDDPDLKPAPINYPFEGIRRISLLHPRSMVIIGGGEPTLYRSGDYAFQELVEEVIGTNPDVRLALVTNGTHRPRGDWPNRFHWIRVSLDAATDGTYRSFRGKGLFDRVLENYLDYLDFDLKEVGISFLFAQSNVHEYASVARHVFELVKCRKPRALGKVSIAYRPLRQDPYRYDRPFCEAVTDDQIARTVAEVRALADSSHELKAFLKNQTNVTAILGGNSHPPHEFARCYYSQTFHIVRANGDLRPCFIRVQEPDFKLGNIVTDELASIALNSLYVAALRKPHCDAHGCRQCHVNYTFEQGLAGTLRPSVSSEVQADPMF